MPLHWVVFSGQVELIPPLLAACPEAAAVEDDAGAGPQLGGADAGPCEKVEHKSGCLHVFDLLLRHCLCIHLHLSKNETPIDCMFMNLIIAIQKLNVVKYLVQ